MDNIPYGYCHCGCGQKTKLAPQSHTSLGWIKGEPIFYVSGHATRRPAEERFWEKVHKTSECWIWQAGKDKDGYGQFNRNRRPIRAHRFSYELHFGPIPDGLFVLHHCDRPSCVAPHHLFVGNQSENQFDALHKGRHTTQVRSRNGRQKIDAGKAAYLYQLYATGRYSQVALAKLFGVNRSTVSRYVRIKA